jgi:hypothetical protein
MTRYRLAAELPEELGRELRALIEEVRAAEHPGRLAPRGVDMILRLTEAGLESFFLRSARRLQLGMISESSIRLGLRTARGGIGLFVKGLAHGLSDEQVRRLGERMDEMLIEEEKEVQEGARDGG